MLKVGDIAPDFALADSEGKIHTLGQYRGKTVVVYFYPKDHTPGCTRQACAFGARYGEFEKRGVSVIGISRDSVQSHAKFKEKNSLPFILLADPELSCIKEWGVWQEKKNYGKVSMGVVRTTFVIDADGKVAHVMPKVKPDTNADDVLALI